MTHVPPRLVEHLRSWAGEWPPPRPGVSVVANERNALPGWDAVAHPVTGAVDDEGNGVLGVAPAIHRQLAVAGRVELANSEVEGLLEDLPTLLGRPDLEAYRAIFRWSTAPTDLPAVGEWVDVTHPAVPAWLIPFGGRVLLVVNDEGAYVAGVGLKHHDEAGWEIAVGTEPAVRGQGLARRLVTRAAREVLEHGAVPTYFHDPDNLASAHVAEAAGFPDRGWTAFGTYQPNS